MLRVLRVDIQILKVDRRVLRVDRQVLRIDKRMDRRVLRVDKQVLRVLQVVERVPLVTSWIFQVLRVLRRFCDNNYPELMCSYNRFLLENGFREIPICGDYIYLHL